MNFIMSSGSISKYNKEYNLLNTASVYLELPIHSIFLQPESFAARMSLEHVASFVALPLLFQNFKKDLVPLEFLPQPASHKGV